MIVVYMYFVNSFRHCVNIQVDKVTRGVTELIYYDVFTYYLTLYNLNFITYVNIFVWLIVSTAVFVW